MDRGFRRGDDVGETVATRQQHPPLPQLVAPAKAGAHFSGIALAEAWTPAFAGVTMGRKPWHAQTLMLTTNEPLCQIALACGFYDQSHLTRVFRRCAGTSPRDWRRRHRDRVVPLQAREGAGR